MDARTMKDIYLPEPATLLEVKPFTEMETYYRIKLDSGRPLGHKPGQFAEISLAGIGEAPISISSSPVKTDHFEMVIRNVGNLTRALRTLKDGDRVGIRGPFGTSFPVNDVMKGKDLLYICGGMGLVPMRSVIQYTLDHRDDYGEITICYGTKSPSERLFTDELENWGKRKDIAFLETVDRGDDSWKGNVGVITKLMPGISIDPHKTVALVCGPPIMYKFVLLELRKMEMSNENIYMSLERHMKCGVGKCGHCQINGLYACQDGPVFKYSEIADVKEAI
ncbi:MAG: FAD/NAD(P)-binding protein [Spirochaetales bacterium]|nr:FAD/NAD(P)-binding protein [Spirochaetales bacterium]